MGYNLNSGYGQLQAEIASLQAATTGKIFMVAASGNGAFDMLTQMFVPDYDGTVRMYSTIDAAISACTAGRGDVVLVAPGHTETVAAAGGIAQDVAGVSVIGLGVGDNAPSITFGTLTTASWTVSADNCAIKNIRGVAGLDGLTNPFNITGGNPNIDIRWDDASSTVEAVRAILLTNLNGANIKLRYNGFIAGDAVVNAVRCNNVGNSRIDVDFYGRGGVTAVVEFVTALSDNVIVTGNMYTSGVTNQTVLVVDTITGSLWAARIFDMTVGAFASGGSGATMALDDISAITSALALPTADSTANADIGDQIGNKTDTAVADTIEGNVMTTQSINRMIKSILQRLGADSANNTAATTLVAGNADGSVLERLEFIQGQVGGTDSAANILGANDADNEFDSTNVVVNANGSVLERLEYIQDAELVGGVDAVTNTQMSDVVGNKTDAAIADTIEGAAATTQSLVADLKAVLQRLGADSANNTAATTLVADNRDGSVLERLESIIATLRDDVATNFIGADNANNTAATTLVAANVDGSLLERSEYIQQQMAFANLDRNAPNYIAVTADLTSATWNTQATHELLTVTGLVRVRIVAECTSTLTDAADGASIQLGHETTTNAFIASTQAAGAGGNTIEAGELWIDTSPADLNAAFSTTIDQLVPNGRDVGYEITGAALTGGTIVFHCWWVPISATGAVVAGAGGAL